MDPIEVIDLCRQAAHKGAPKDVFIPRVFSVGDYQDLWTREAKKVRAILDDLMCAPHVDEGLELLLRFNVLYALFPEVSAMKGMGDEGGLHKDVWEHSKAVVVGVPPELDLRWGALMHDIGKVKTRRVWYDGSVTFYGHAIVGAHLVDLLNDRTKLFSDDVRLLRTVRYLVLKHMRPADYTSEWTDSAVRRLIAECGDVRFFEKLMLLSRADLTTKNPKKRELCLSRSAELERRVAHIIEVDSAPRLPKGTMGTIMSKVAAKPGPWLQKVRDRLESMMKNGALERDRDVDYYVKAGLDLVETWAASPGDGAG